MTIQKHITNYLNSLPESKRADIESIHLRITQAMPDCKLWFFDGRDENGKIVANPQIGYGIQTMKYADGKSKEFYQVGISANTSGISVYFMGLKDKKYLQETYGPTIGKASVTGYCIKFRSLKDININSLETAITDCFKKTS